jgi:putative salt-induced outer membrane protein YdiY
MSRMSVWCAVVLVVCSVNSSVAQPPAEPPPLWDVQAGASFVGTSGNTEITSTGADFVLHRRWPVWQIESTASAVRTSDQEIVKAERYAGTLRGQRRLSAIAALSSGLKAEHDAFAGMDLRSILDVGVTWALLRAPRWTLDGITALAWNHETPTRGAKTNDAISLLQLLSRVPFGTAGDTTQRFTAYPNFSRTEAFRSEAEVTAQAAMNSRLALKMGYLVRYSRTPVPGFETTDSTMTASVVLRWRSVAPAP